MLGTQCHYPATRLTIACNRLYRAPWWSGGACFSAASTRLCRAKQSRSPPRAATNFLPPGLVPTQGQRSQGGGASSDGAALDLPEVATHYALQAGTSLDTASTAESFKGLMLQPPACDQGADTSRSAAPPVSSAEWLSGGLHSARRRKQLASWVICCWLGRAEGHAFFPTFSHSRPPIKATRRR